MPTPTQTSTPKAPMPTLTAIEGKKQVIALLKAMAPDDKNKLLKNLKIRNPLLADELCEAGASFHELETLSKEQVSILLNSVPAPIIGLALKKARPSLQKHILRHAPRHYAQEAFQIMQTPLMDSLTKIDRAQDKTMLTAQALFGPNFHQLKTI